MGTMQDSDHFAAVSEPAAPEVVALAASMGGIAAFTQILSELPADFPAPVLLLQHLSEGPCLLPDLLSRRTRLTVTAAREGQALTPGRIYVAPPGLHLLVRPDKTLTLSDAERVCFVRPSADRLFESVAAAFGDRSAAVVLTGKGRDGANGIRAVHKAGGLTIAQSPQTCQALDMPAAAIETGCVDMVLPLHRIAAVLEVLAGSFHPPPPAYRKAS
jgi:two-component system, chemotaxis family, protein-glutamate methylesterase/glutaminase